MSLATPKLLTAAEFAQLPEPADGSRQELVKGVIETMPPPRFEHGFIAGNAYFAIRSYLQSQRLGRATTGSGAQTESDPDTVRGPDVAYWSFERLPAGVPIETYPAVAPDLVVEVLSPGEAYGRIQQKISEYLAAGVRLVWVIDPQSKTVSVHRPASSVHVVRENEALFGEDVLPGFSCPAGALFA
jgi:Uma2 family endonuclease